MHGIQQNPASAGVQKAARLIVLLGDEVASGILQHLREIEIEQIAAEIPRVGAIHENEAYELYRLTIGQSRTAAGDGGIDYVRRMLSKTLGSNAADRVINRLELDQAPAAFRRLAAVNPAQLAELIRNEHPQTITLLLAHFPPGAAAELLACLAEDVQPDVSVRMAELLEVPQEATQSIAAALEERLGGLGPHGLHGARTGVRSVAELLNHMSPLGRQKVLQQMDLQEPEAAKSIRELMFTFDDIFKLDDAVLRQIIQQIDKKTIAWALKGVTGDRRQRFLNNMSQRAAQLLEEEIEVIGPVKVKDVFRAQQRVVETIRQLETEGSLSITGAEEYVT